MIIHFVCHQIICFRLLQPHGWVDIAESEVAILILESTWLIADNVSVHARMDNMEFINSMCHSKLEMSPRQLLIDRFFLPFTPTSHLVKLSVPDILISYRFDTF